MTHFNAASHNIGHERYVKTVVTLRNRAIYSRSKKVAQSMFFILTAVHTMQANGITNIYEYYTMLAGTRADNALFIV